MKQKKVVNDAELESKEDFKKPIKPIYKTSLSSKYGMCEMVFNEEENYTKYICKNKETGKMLEYEDQFYNGVICKPLPTSHMLLQKHVVLFPAKLQDYGSEEELIKEIKSFIHTYVDISEVFEGISTYYVLLSWLYDKFNEVPYLRAIGDYGSGKSRFLQTIGSICYKPIFTAGATTVSPIFRILDETRGTLVMDESDLRFSDMTSDMVKILNTGYQKGVPVLRSEGKGVFEVKAYEVYSPKVIATREKFKDDALESRFLVEEMGVQKLRADIPMTLDDKFYNDALSLRNKLLQWRFDNYFEPTNKIDLSMVPNIHPRLKQIIMPLLSIIKDPSVKKELVDFIVKYNANLLEDRGLSRESDIILAIFIIEHEQKKTDITMKDIAGEVNFGNDNDDDLSPKKIGWYLRSKLQLKPEKSRLGYVISTTKNKQKLEFWKGRYGITHQDITGELVNDVNKETEEVTQKSIDLVESNDDNAIQNS